jgi:cell wall-associated NlpC family hydrolase
VAAAGTGTAQPVGASGSAVDVIEFALGQVGKPYRRNAAGPGGFDCSGLVMMAFARAGFHLPHGTGGILGYGSPVDRGSLQAGDIVFPTAGHVAIYLGGNQIVEAANERGGIRVTSLWGFYAARRLL